MNAVLQKLRDEIIFCKHILTLAFEETSPGINKNDPKTISFLVNSCYVNFWISWEGFLEESFHSYMVGTPSITGIVLLRHFSPSTAEQAQKMVIGINRYFDWAKSDFVIRMSNIIFGITNPFETTLKSIQADLEDMKTIRNSAAHISTTTQAQLNAVATRVLGTPISLILPSDLLMRNLIGVSVPTTIFQNYMKIIDAAAEAIAKA